VESPRNRENRMIRAVAIHTIGGSCRWRLSPILFLLLVLSLSMPYLSEGFSQRSIYRTPMVWQDETGASFVLSHWKGKRVIITMWYTTCWSRCPITMQKLKDIQKRFNKRLQKVEFVLVTLDPHQDTAQALARFRKSYGLTAPNWHFLRGSEADTRKLASLLGFGEYQNMGDGILHSLKISRLDEAGEIARTLDWDHQNVDSLFQ
jgi:protein SCO1/2